MNTKFFEPMTHEQFIDNSIAQVAMCDAKLSELNAEIDKETTKIKMAKADSINHFQQLKDEASVALKVFACNHPEYFPASKKSIKTQYGTFGFRLGKPKFFMAQGFTWEMALKKIEQVLPQYKRVTTEVAKDKLLADRNLPEVSNYFPAMGLSVVQEESFYIDLKK